MLNPKTENLLSSNQFSLKSYRFIQTRGMKLSQEQAIKAAQEGAKYIYRYIWETPEIQEDVSGKKLPITTQLRIINPDNPEFYEKVTGDKLSAYVDIKLLYKKFKLDSDKGLSNKTWKETVRESQLNLLRSLREVSNTFSKEISAELKKKHKNVSPKTNYSKILH